MALHAANHAWNSGDGLEKDDTVHPATFVEFLGIVACNEIEACTNTCNCSFSNTITDTLRRLVSVFDLLYGLLRVDRVRHAIALRVQHDSVLGHLVQKALACSRWLHCSYLRGFKR